VLRIRNINVDATERNELSMDDSSHKRNLPERMTR
jgi:hypothetical protein